ncbi:MAG: hypothetical protein WD872_21775 [Pirellulaceae bacterium]
MERSPARVRYTDYPAVQPLLSRAPLDDYSMGGTTVMEFNRNQYFLAGLVVFLLGVQMRMVEAFVLNERATQFLAQRIQDFKGNEVASASDLPSLFAAQAPIAKHRLEPPKWLGWALVSVGSVLILHSLAMKKPGG